ncbi:MAG TPA: hypothetical protein VFP50_15555 [Anaeromyxobacteraceae bacterium]|nr:hypothetical protein [Anaeromyxobacteraceae bacterium]
MKTTVTIQEQWASATVRERAAAAIELLLETAFPLLSSDGQTVFAAEARALEAGLRNLDATHVALEQAERANGYPETVSEGIIRARQEIDRARAAISTRLAAIPALLELWGFLPDGTTATDEQIQALRAEAGAAGDLAQVELCDRALAGDASARVRCARVIADAAAMVEA